MLPTSLSTTSRFADDVRTWRVVGDSGTGVDEHEELGLSMFLRLMRPEDGLGMVGVPGVREVLDVDAAEEGLGIDVEEAPVRASFAGRVGDGLDGREGEDVVFFLGDGGCVTAGEPLTFLVKLAFSAAL